MLTAARMYTLPAKMQAQHTARVFTSLQGDKIRKLQQAHLLRDPASATAVVVHPDTLQQKELLGCITACWYLNITKLQAQAALLRRPSSSFSSSAATAAGAEHVTR